jgi:hypothetical protein
MIKRLTECGILLSKKLCVFMRNIEINYTILIKEYCIKPIQNTSYEFLY